MVYEWNQVGIEEITNLYLYGAVLTPTNLADDDLIRDSNVAVVIQVDIDSFMESGPGRFALGSQSALVEEFFSEFTDLSWLESNREYTKEELFAGLVARGADFSYYGIDVRHVLLADMSNDYWLRSYIWNSQSFKLSDDVRFVIDSDGARIIKNYSVIPKGGDNFDFVGGGYLADIGNYLLEPAVDPWGIGRQVLVEFVGDSSSSRSYTIEDYNNDVLAHASYLAMGVASASTLSLAIAAIDADLWDHGVTRATFRDRAIIYGTNDSDTMISESMLNSLPVMSHLKTYGQLNGLAIVAGAGNDYVVGGDKDDYVWGNAGVDTLHGGVGNDTLWGMEDADYLDGGTGDDILDGGKGDDRYDFHSGDGNDQVIDSDGQGSLWLGDARFEGGKEVLAGAGSWRSADGNVTYALVSNPDQTQTLYIQYGDSLIRVNNYVLGQLGITLDDADDAPPPADPALDLVGDKKPIDVDSTEPGDQYDYDELENVLTTDAVEVRKDVLHGDVGNDSIQGLGDDDQLYGKGGNDTLEGGVGQDLLVGGGDNDLLIGGEGSDIVRGDEGDDSLYATAQVDIASVREQTEGSGLKGDWLTGGLGDDVVVGDSGKDVLFGGGGKDTVFGGAGDDVINGDDNFIATSFNWVVDSYGSTFQQFWSPVQIEQWSLEVGGNDFLYGGAGNDWVGGLIGNDYLYGEAGDDTLKGGAGHDLLFGGDDNDLITGDYSKYAYDSDGSLVVQGNDTMDGGAGDDAIQGEAGEDLLIGAAGNDTLWGDARYLNGGDHGNDRLEGGIDNDNMFGDGGNDVLYGGEGNDLVVGDQIEPELAGQYHGKDTLYGEAGMDTMFGGGGNDELYGGSEDDQLSGDFALGDKGVGVIYS